MGQRLSVACKLKPLGVGVAKASLNRATEYVALDPQASALDMGRVKVQ